MDRRKHSFGDCEGMAHYVSDDDHAYKFVKEFLELINHVRTLSLGGPCDLLTSRSIVAR